MRLKINDPEITVGFRKLLEAKDCFVRAVAEAEEANARPKTNRAVAMEDAGAAIEAAIYAVASAATWEEGQQSSKTDGLHVCSVCSKPVISWSEHEYCMETMKEETDTRTGQGY